MFVYLFARAHVCNKIEFVYGVCRCVDVRACVVNVHV